MIPSLPLHRSRTVLAAACLTLLALLAALPAGAQEFKEVPFDVGAVTNWWGTDRGQASFLDFDKDGDLDFLTAGPEGKGMQPVLRVYRNTGGRFSLFSDFQDAGASKTEGAAWADLNKDGYAELVTWIPILVPDTSADHDSGKVQVFSYDPGSDAFQPRDYRVNVSGILDNPLFQFSDYDKDGFPDLLVSGWRKPDRSIARAPYTRILHNSAGDSLSDTAIFPTPTANAVAAWNDIDADGDLDLFLAGTMFSSTKTPTRSARLFKYSAGQFTLYYNLNPAFDVHSASMADYDRDGKGDLVLCGGGGSGNLATVTRLYRNTGTFLQVRAVEPFLDGDIYTSANHGAVHFGDGDGDGDPDLLVTGEPMPSPLVRFTEYYENDGGSFYARAKRLPPFWNSLAQLVDFDGDGHLDIFLSGSTTNPEGQATNRTALLRNLGGNFDTAVSRLDSLSGKRARWGDYDNDSDMDLVVCGSPDSLEREGRRCALYRNQDGSFSAVATPFDTLFGDPEWGDYDRDGRIDMLLAGSWGPEGRLRLFRNTGGGGFSELPLDDPLEDEASYQAAISARWGDFDNDGDLDILTWGEHSTGIPPSGTCFSEVLLNRGGGRFDKAEGTAMPGVCDGELEWGDYDKDGDLDVLLAGDTLSSGYNGSLTAVYRNQGGTLQRTEDQIPSLSHARVAWGDFDADGDLDFALSGANYKSGSPGSGENFPTTWIFRLVDGSYEDFWMGEGLIGDVAWVDFDNDGDLDLLNAGRYHTMFTTPANVNIMLLMRNNGMSFSSYFFPFSTLQPESNSIKGELDVADFDNDGDLDFVVAGRSLKYPEPGEGSPLVRIYKNTLRGPNRAPTAPSGLAAVLGPSSVDLSWSGASDAETMGSALRYNLRVGTSPGAGDVVSPAADPATGYRLLPDQANAASVRSARLGGLAQGTYYWSVQSVDLQKAASSFAQEGSFTLGLPAPVLLEAALGPGNGRVTLRWNRLPQRHFRRYYIHYGKASGATARLDSMDRAEDTVFTVSGLENDSTWYFRVSAADLGGNASAYSNELTAVPDGTPPAIPSGLSATPGDRSITLSWTPNTESDFLCYLVYQRNASGPIVKIDSIPASSVNSTTISGLKNGTPYSFLVVAVDRVLNHSGFSAEAVAIPSYLLTPSAPAVAFGKVHLDGNKQASLTIRNSSGLPVPVDSIRFVNAAFGLKGTFSSFPAAAETTLTLVFDPDRGAGGDFAGVFKLYYGGSKVPLEIDLSGSATALPHCSIDQIVPGDLAWDSTTAISFLARANDSDNAGEGDRIVSYLWASSLAGPLEGNASGFTLKPSQLGLGAHAITLRVVDNEGDTSLAAHGSVTIRSLKPLVRIDSITPAGLIIRGADPIRIQCSAYDLDEGAGPGKPDLASFQLVSTLQGVISGSTDTTLGSTALSLGLHGFYARATDDEGDVSVSDTIWVPVQADVGLALLVAGTDFNDNRYFYENIAPNCNWAYSQLRKRGFTDSMITYFNPVGWQSIGGDYHQDSRIVDETEVTVAKLRERILGYKQRVRSGVPLLISFIGHGGQAEKQNGKFYLSTTEYLVPDSLDAWLDTYNQDEDGKVTDSISTPIVLVFDFCFSGSFFPKLRSSTQNRMVIASSAVDRQAYFKNGRSFSYALYRQIEKGGNLTEAFTAGKAWSDANTTLGLDKANPLANADNDNTSNESEDFLRMNTVYIGGSQQDQGPEAAWKDVQLPYDAGSKTFRVVAYPEGQATVDTAWVIMLPPGFQDPKAGAVDPFISKPLTRQSDGTYTALMPLDPVVSGDYLFMVYGIKDKEEMMPAVKRANPDPAVGLVRRSGIPARFDLGLNYPNPAVTQTFIPLAVTRYGKAELKIYGMDGRLVRRLFSAALVPGYYLMSWDGRDQFGRKQSPGIYTYTLQSAEGLRRRTLVWGR